MARSISVPQFFLKEKAEKVHLSVAVIVCDVERQLTSKPDEC